MSEIKNVGYTWMAKCHHLTPMPFKGLTKRVATLLFSDAVSDRQPVTLFFVKYLFLSGLCVLIVLCYVSYNL